MKSFVNSTSLNDSVYPAHNAALTGDTLFSIQFNHAWRELVAGVLVQAWRNDLSTTALDNHDRLSALLFDLYNAEVIGTMLNYKTQQVDLSTNKTTTSGVFVLLSGSGISFTPTKANFIVTCSNLTLVNSGAGSVEAVILFNTVFGSQYATARTENNTARTLKASAKYTGVTIGVAHNLEIYWKVSSGTGTAQAGTWLIWEIWEFD